MDMAFIFVLNVIILKSKLINKGRVTPPFKNNNMEQVIIELVILKKNECDSLNMGEPCYSKKSKYQRKQKYGYDIKNFFK